MCTALNMTVDSAKFVPYITSCEEKHFFICTIKTGVYTKDKYYNMTLIEPEELNIVNVKTSDTTSQWCAGNLRQKFKGFVAVYDEDVKSCTLYTTNPVFFHRNYQLLPVSNHNIVYVKTSGINYAVTGNLTVPVKQHTMACVPNLGLHALTHSPPTIEPVFTGTVTSTDIPSSPNATLCTCQPVAYTMRGEIDFASLIRSLRINRAALSSYKRKRMSMSDDRTSCLVMGYVAAIVIFGSCSCIVILDIPIFFRTLKSRRWTTCYILPRVINGNQTNQ
ncbi:uncharacterized protein LOC117328898 [Pecten maximus]|uniref:uncharacterized protein LOC117328898 n=1 Tax=Pecten maximus TaxID=6579 RepID=UPI0014580BC2|nr:uncharacterized protein LOC117328898 [Pecten maximus]